MSTIDQKSNHQRPRRLRKPNEVFDRMVETMSVVSSYTQSSEKSLYRRRIQNRKSRRESSLVQISSSPDTSASGRHNERLTRSKVSLEASDEKCLPSWMVDTFLSLSKDHPLRLLLPPQLNLPDLKNHDSTSQEPSNDSVFAFNDIDQTPSRPSSLTLCSNFGVTSSTPIDEEANNMLLPFSTPGPASQISVSASIPAPLFTSAFRSTDRFRLYTDEMKLLDAHTVTPEYQEAVPLDYDIDQDTFAYNLMNGSSSPTLRSSSPPLPKSLTNAYEEAGNVPFRWTSFDRASIIARPVQKKVMFALDDDELADYMMNSCYDVNNEELGRDDVSGYDDPDANSYTFKHYGLQNTV